MDINVVINKLIMLLFVMTLGYIAKKKNIVNELYNKGYSAFILNISLPCLIISSILSTDAKISKFHIFQIIIVGIGIYLFQSIIAIFWVKIFKPKKNQDGVYKFLAVFNNNMFMGFPVIQSVLGDEALFYCAIFNIANSMFMFSIGIYFMSKHKQVEKISVKKMLNPGIISSILCTVLYFAGFKLPLVLQDGIRQVGNITVPLSMIVLGIALSDIPVRDVFTDIKIYILSIIKMIIIPLIIFLIISNFINNPIILYVIIITLAMPGPTLSVSMATEYESDTTLASKYVFMSTVLSIATIPLIIQIIV